MEGTERGPEEMRSGRPVGPGWACAGWAGVPRACDGVRARVRAAGAGRPRPGAAGLKATGAGGDRDSRPRPECALLHATRRESRGSRTSNGSGRSASRRAQQDPHAMSV